MSVLMCKDNAVYDIEAEQLLNYNLLPGAMRSIFDNNSLKNWLKKRYSSGTNTLARQLRGITFGQGNRIAIDKTTRALSLSDCYWIKDRDDNIRFKDISPYYADFWKGDGKYAGGAIPTLYVPGYISKAWISSEYLYKTGCAIEIECADICLKLGLNCACVKEYDKGIIVKNFTNPQFMLEQADMSGNFEEEYYTNGDILRGFGADGFKMILIDAVFGNGDRHPGNFGYIRNADTGDYTGIAPLYDFDHALDARGTDDILIDDAAKIMRENSDFAAIGLELLGKIISDGFVCRPVFKDRSKIIIKKFTEG
ncbi:MAG: hypothetical protein FWD71_03970 [Oscillospiraceae bacterium]|nr:hypothetical protein [Oscillospiraceae bacterium]